MAIQYATRNSILTSGRPSSSSFFTRICRSKMNCCYYQCVHCLSPVSSLYRQYGGASGQRGRRRRKSHDANSNKAAVVNPSSNNNSKSYTLKLSVCQTCGDNVDPYVEREWLLIVLDMVLLREEAYRHVLLNNDKIRLVVNQKSQSTFCLQYLLASSILQAYILWEAALSSSPSSETSSLHHFLLQYNITNGSVFDVNNEDLKSMAWEFARLVFISLLDHCVLAITCFVVLICLLPQQQQQQQSRAVPLQLQPLKTMILASRIYIGILLPTTFSFVTILALCWENTDTVRMLGGFLIRCFQIMALQTIALAALKITSTTNNTSYNDDNDIVQKKKDDDFDDSKQSKSLLSTASSSSMTTFTAYVRLKALMPVAVGMVTRIVVVGAVMNAMIQKEEGEHGAVVPCTGFMYNVHGTFVCLS